jgi:uncharacterized protein YebE (UPF0316 family)
MNPDTLMTGLVIFLARICDVSLGTIRTIVIIQGRMRLAFILGFFEVLVWISIVSTVVHKVREEPVIVFFYALGFATGNAVGIWVERKLAFGLVVLRVITRDKGREIAERLRELGQAVTSFMGEGKLGQVCELYVVCRRRDLRSLLAVVTAEDAEAFYITEQVHDVNRALRPICPPCQSVSEWNTPLKKK